MFLSILSVKLQILGEGSLSISGNNVKMSVDKIVGDSSGILTVRPTQTIHMRGLEGHLPFSLLSQKGSNVTFPTSMNCRGVEVAMRGVMGEMTNLTVGPQCRFVLENSTETEFALDHVVVQTDGYMAAIREDRQDVRMIGKTFDIRGGAKVSSLSIKLSCFANSSPSAALTFLMSLLSKHKKAISEAPFASLSKQVFVRNL